jgi:hypothetical protein
MDGGQPMKQSKLPQVGDIVSLKTNNREYVGEVRYRIADSVSLVLVEGTMVSVNASDIAEWQAFL